MARWAQWFGNSQREPPNLFASTANLKIKWKFKA